ncbi:MAG: NAD-dependent epimerase/dehydratase family protein [Cyanobacteria bacterium M_surface_7_m2_040]|nr:NAD-dependent epimerase/dehydratase family protein [Cyanobacteria bacterium K_DeepCast_35m_m2_023]MBM5828487.1 NAD-dependent epimerase/dehydratase family protein [Cyanobacteria bacterium M_surface_7_m2_040]
MVPSQIVRLDVLPLNVNGKLDRRALPDVTHIFDSEPPRPGLEQSVAAIFEELLRIRGLGRDDDFFRNGGNSLLAARLQVLLRERLGLALSAADLYAAPTVAALAGQRDDGPNAAAWATARAGLLLTEPIALLLPRPQRPDVLLTGASGFLGIYLLRDLLETAGRVTCLMRGYDLANARAVLTAQATSAGLLLDLDRVEIVLGDLAADNLGLQPAITKALADQIDLIVHCGAWVHHLYSYTTLRASNVDATASLLRLALAGQRRASFCLVSTEAVGQELAGAEEVPEAVLDPQAHPSQSASGYVLSKWVAEQLVAAAARDHGLTAVIARPGNITGDSSSGFSNFSNNHFWLFTKAGLQLSLVPDLPNGVEMTPVDQLSAAIAALALTAKPGLEVTNLGNPDELPWTTFIDQVAGQLGRHVSVVDSSAWQTALAAADPDNAQPVLHP